MAERDVIETLFDKAFEIEEQKETLYKERAGVRDGLRHMRAAGMLTSDQEEQLQELYPDVQRNRKAA